jgi:hypothetical protein
MTGQYPRLRSHTRKRASGKVDTYYFYDRRADGEPDIPLGKDWDEAVKKWDEIHNRLPRIAGTLEEAFDRWEKECLPLYENAETKRVYALQLKRLRPVFGPAAWYEVSLPDLKGYLTARSAKTQANREMALLSIIWNWARLVGLTDIPFPAAGMGRSRWKNKEKPRRFHVTLDLFQAVYEEGDQVLRDCMDLASAAGMRLTDCRTILLPKGDTLHLTASKTGKDADFDLTLSEVLPELVARRRRIKTNCMMLLVTPKGRPISYEMLRDRWDEARRLAALKVYAAAGLAFDETPEQAEAWAFAMTIRKMWLRDMRKFASSLAPSDEAAAELLQHSDVRVTRKHYRTGAAKLKLMR